MTLIVSLLFFSSGFHFSLLHDMFVFVSTELLCFCCLWIMKIRCFQLCETSGSHWHGLTLPLSLAQMSRPWVKRAWWHNCKFAGFCVLVVCQRAGLKGGDLRNQCFQGSLRFARSLGPDLAQRRSHFVPSREETNVVSQISGLCTHPFLYPRLYIYDIHTPVYFVMCGG